MSLRDVSVLEHSLAPAQRRAVAELARLLHARYSTTLHRLILFGSRARGDAGDASDIDVLIVLDVPDEQLPKEVDHVWETVAGAKRHAPGEWVPIAPLVLSRHQFEDLLRLRRRIAVDAEREGIEL